MKDKQAMNSLRDQFAMTVLPAVFTHMVKCAGSDGVVDAKRIADWAYEIADAMIEEKKARDVK